MSVHQTVARVTVQQYADAVRDGSFPTLAHCFGVKKA